MHACMHGTVATKYSRIHAMAGRTRIPSPLQNISVGCRGYARYFIRLYASWAQQLDNEMRITILAKANGNAKLERMR